jgi:F-type H+-transporting ATPase subunit delta
LLFNPVARVYAEALFAIATDKSQVEEIGAELHDFLELTRAEPNIARFMDSPVIDATEKVRALRDALSGRASDTTCDFLCLLVEKGRAASLPSITEAYQAMADEREGRARVTVTTATPLAAPLVEEITKMLTAKLNKKIAIDQTVEPKVLGGAVIAIGDKVYDGSIRNRLSQFRKQIMRSGGYANQG